MGESPEKDREKERERKRERKTLTFKSIILRISVGQIGLYYQSETITEREDTKKEKS